MLWGMATHTNINHKSITFWVAKCECGYRTSVRRSPEAAATLGEAHVTQRHTVSRWLTGVTTQYEVVVFRTYTEAVESGK